MAQRPWFPASYRKYLHGMRWLGSFTRTRPVVVAVVGVVLVASVAFSVLIGLPFVVPVALLAVVAAGMLWWARRRERRRGERPATASLLGAFAAIGIVVLAVIQVVPYGRAHGAPATTGEPAWASPETRELVVRACYSCHSSETEYPWYSSIAPVSWATQRHIDEGREAVNFSQFATDPGEAEESVDVVEDDEMPPAYFTRFGLHPEAQLSAEERQALIDGLLATPGLHED